MRRTKDWEWTIPVDENNRSSWEGITVAVLMDIRDELRAIREATAVLNCPNFQQLPMILRAIRANTSKSRPKKIKLRRAG